MVGTGTEVGKTWVTARLVNALVAAGHQVWARKPAQSFDPSDDPASTDAAVLAAVTGESPMTVCPVHRWYPVAMAPPMAAAALGRPAFTVTDLLDELSWPTPDPASATRIVDRGKASVGLVETAGGVRSPQADDGDCIDLLEILAPDVVILVADAGLGTIHSVRLCLDALSLAHAEADPSPAFRPKWASSVLVVLNRFDPASELHLANRRWIEERDGAHVLVIPGEEHRLVAAVT
ncbi:MAG: ATP-dependent dethiobiotin synthetase BioD [Acidimicrobiales bacterium]